MTAHCCSPDRFPSAPGEFWTCAECKTEFEAVRLRDHDSESSRDWLSRAKGAKDADLVGWASDPSRDAKTFTAAFFPRSVA